MSDHYGQFDRSPELTPGDLTRGLHWLETEADRGSPSARAVLEERERLRKALSHAGSVLDAAERNPRAAYQASLWLRSAYPPTHPNHLTPEQVRASLHA